MVILTLAQLGSNNTLIMCVDLNGIANKNALMIIRECYEAIKKHKRPLVFEKPTLVRINKNSYDFENLHGISYVLGVSDGSHIPIIPPSWDPTLYHNTIYEL